jgi:flagellar hook protein FlgE
LTLNGNINLDTNTQIVVPASIYDSYGTEYAVEIAFTKNATNDWSYVISDGTGIEKFFDDIEGSLAFDDTPGNVGNIDTVTNNAGDALPNNLIIEDITFNSGNGDTINVKFDLSQITQYDSETSATVYDVDGYTAGELVDYTIGEDGVLTGVYSNGEQQPLAKLALATFANEQGLKRVEGGMYSVTSNSGNFNAISANTLAGSFVSCALELSNVDLSTEFTDMIITQRGFQANSKIISTSDELLQELVNLKR